MRAPVRIIWLIIVVVVCNSSLQAQKKFISGVTVDHTTGKGVGSASIRNIITGITVLSHIDGRFNTSVSKGNILSFSASGYYTDTLTATDSVLALSVLEIHLRPLPATLPDVYVTAKLNPYQIDSLERRKNFLSTVGEVKIPTVSKANDLGFGIGINLDRFGKREKEKRSARDLFDITEEEAYINFRWTDTLVQKYTKLSGDSLTGFMQDFRPTWDWLRNNEDEEDLLYYINKSLKKYYKR